MKIATVGKGGSGKTTIAGSLARIFAEEGQRILAIDGDPNPNLALTLGMTKEAADGIEYIPASVMRPGEKVDGVTMMEPALPLGELMTRYGHRAAENVDLIVMGKPAHGTAGSGCMCASHRAVRGLISELTAYGDHTVTDMEAGLEHLKRGTARHVDMMLVVAEPYYRSLEAAQRTAELAEELGIRFVRVVANKVRGTEDEAAIGAFCVKHSMQLIASVPYDEAMIEAEREGRAPYDFAATSAGMVAIRDLAAKIGVLAATMGPRGGAGGVGSDARL
ncbi:MAG: AAA family ATPase [Pseudomonadota bacterium]